MQKYNITDKQIHWLSQVIAKVNRTLVPEQEDDSHTNLYFDAIGKKLFGRWISSPKGKFVLSLNLTNHRFEWLNSRLQNQFDISFVNKELKFLEQEVTKFPASMGLNIEKMAEPLHFEIPDYNIQAIHDREILQEGIATWSKIRELANNSCLAVLGFLQKEGEIRIWPHHFDTGIYVQVTESLGIGFGLAMEDAMVGEPYFYLAGYSSDSGIIYKELPDLDSGKWITGEHWNGAVMPLSVLLNRKDSWLDIVNTFSQKAINWYLEQ